MQKSDLPFGSEFSPSQIDLPSVLELARKYAGNWKAFEDSVREAYFEKTHFRTTEYNRRKLANNTKLGLIAYGIYDRAKSALTLLGQKLYGLRNNGSALYSELARHILLNLNGMALVQCAQDIQAAGEAVDLIKLRQWLEERGVHFPRGGKHPSMMRLWLEKAGVFSSGWRISEARLNELLGLSTGEVDALSALTSQQRAYIRTLVNMGGPGPYASNDVEKLAATTYGVKFNEKALAKSVLYPLASLGYVRLERGTKTKGRGAKPFAVYPTDKLVHDVVSPLLEQMEKQTAADLRPMLRKPLTEILDEIGARDRHVRGLALEALAFKLMRLIDLNYIATRLRGTATGGAEVDLIFESDRLVFSRWQVQCKNTARVSLDDAAKEVGLVHMLKSNVIVIASTGEIGPEARKYANTVMKDSNLCIVMIDRTDTSAIVENPACIVDVLNREARSAMKIKKLEF